MGVGGGQGAMALLNLKALNRNSIFAIEDKLSALESL